MRPSRPKKGIDPAELTGARLIADLGPLTAQIQRASDSAKGLPVRFGVENIAMADDEVTFADMQARIAKTIDFLKTVPREAIDGKEATSVTLVTPNRSFDFTGADFVQHFALPEFLFSHDNRLRPCSA